MFNKTKQYTIEQAIDIVKKMSKTKFDSSIEVHFHLGIDTKKSGNKVRSIVDLPYEYGKSKKIAAFVKTDDEKKAKQAGAKIVGGNELIKQIAETKKIDFNIAVATPDMLKQLSKIAKILGPKNLIPSIKTKTVGDNIENIIKNIKKGNKQEIKNDNTGNVHALIGKVSFANEKLIANYKTILKAIIKAKPIKTKGTYIKNISISSTMGPGIKLKI